MDRLRLLVIGDPASVHVVARAHLFAESGADVRLLAPRAAEGPIPLRLEHPDVAGEGAWAGLRRLVWLWQRLRRPQADLIHVHYAASLPAWLLLAAGGGPPVVVSTMGGDILDDEQFPLPRPARWMTWRLLRHAQAVTAKTEHMAEVLRKGGVPAERVVEIPWGVDLRLFRRRDTEALRAELGLDGSERIILSPRMLRPFYNIHLLVEAMPAVVAAHPGARLLLTEYGAAPAYRAELTQRIEQLGLTGRVVWLGSCDALRMAELYNLADVVVGIPPSDGLSQALLEALACGAPCVTTRLPRFDSLLGGAVVTTTLDPTAVAQAIGAILDDPELAAGLSHRGSTLVAARFDLARSRERVEALYQSLTGRHRPVEPLWVRLAVVGVLAAWMLRNLTHSVRGHGAPAAIV
jgi:glycosyltransferase involved in cell wall biosynthesis